MAWPERWFPFVLLAVLGAASVEAGQDAGTSATLLPAAPTAVELDVKYYISPEELNQILAAIPAAPRAEPRRPRRLLVFSRAAGFYHDAIPHGAQLFAHLGARTGAFAAVVTDDPAVFEPDSLSRFDAVLMNNTTGEIFRPGNYAELGDAARAAADRTAARYRTSLAQFVARGGGLAGIHAATDTLYEWPEYGEMIGGYFAGHPWNEEVGVTVVEPDHPLTAAFAGDFTIADEIYQFREPYSRGKVRVLLALDPARTDMTRPGINRDDLDFPISWIRNYGAGRVFYGSLGHRREIFWHPAVVQFYLDGIQFVLGDLDADADPVPGQSEPSEHP